MALDDPFSISAMFGATCRGSTNTEPGAVATGFKLEFHCGWINLRLVETRRYRSGFRI